MGFDRERPFSLNPERLSMNHILVDRFWIAAALCRFGTLESARGLAHSKTLTRSLGRSVGSGLDAHLR